jgi:hypothetical protein
MSLALYPSRDRSSDLLRPGFIRRKRSFLCAAQISLNQPLHAQDRWPYAYEQPYESREKADYSKVEGLGTWWLHKPPQTRQERRKYAESQDDCDPDGDIAGNSKEKIKYTHDLDPTVELSGARADVCASASARCQALLLTTPGFSIRNRTVMITVPETAPTTTILNNNGTHSS